MRSEWTPEGARGKPPRPGGWDQDLDSIGLLTRVSQDGRWSGSDERGARATPRPTAPGQDEDVQREVTRMHGAEDGA